MYIIIHIYCMYYIVSTVLLPALKPAPAPCAKTLRLALSSAAPPPARPCDTRGCGHRI